MKFTIDEKVFTYFPGMKLVVVIARNVNNQINNPEIWTELKQAWVGAGKAAVEYGNPQSHPRIKLWSEHFKALGVSRKDFPTSIESLVRRAGKGSEPMSINPLVDYYNSVSLKYLVPAGGFDIDGLEEGLELRFSQAGDEFQALDDSASFPIPEGEISYADGTRIVTRHFLWRQSKVGLILPSSKNIVLVSEIPGELEERVCEEVLTSLAEGIQKYFRITPFSYIMHANNLDLEL